MEPCCKWFPLGIELEHRLVHGPYGLVDQPKALPHRLHKMLSTTIVLKGEAPRSGKVEIFLWVSTDVNNYC